MVFLGFENLLNNCKTVVSETGNDFKWHIVMRQNQLLISVVEQEVRMLRRVEIMVKKAVVTQEDGMAWKENYLHGLAHV